MGKEFGRYIIGCFLTWIVFDLAGCATSPPPPAYTPTSVGREWKPYRHQRQVLMAAFDGGAAKNGQGYWHVLSRFQEELPASNGPDNGPERNPCREFRLKLEALERCELEKEACSYPLPD